MTSTNVLVIGSGGREHALAWALSRSPLLGALYCAPGNAGMAQVAECVDVGSDPSSVITFCQDKAIDFVVVGPEAPLVDGLVDALEDAGIKAFGPSRAAARLEGSKGFTKDLCRKYNIPTATYARFDNATDAKAYAAAQGAPLVVKADGLAAGKGVVIAETVDDAMVAIDDMFAGAFGTAGAEVVIEEYLEGEEASFFALVDGETVLPLATAQDHKRVGDGDTGPNTGGMGAYSPAPVMTPAMVEATMDRIIRPTVNAMAAEGAPYRGVLYAGLMITESGPQLIEYNVRFGDPECQVLMMRLRSDLLPVLLAAATGTLNEATLDWHDEVALTVVMATRGYPGTYAKGSEIRGLADAAADDDIEIFHASTTADGDRVLATGGRVLNVTALGRTVAEAQARAYNAVDKIDWPEGFCRHDIGWRAVEREKETLS
ncbi:MAG: phosphoribosylamine--glycine ligase [Alphaproteobacteria bacterium]|nr:MAG: phosphoribosylamine--glycine ligase [Alphaproteobacteria bacterium]